MVLRRFDVFLLNHDPTRGHEPKKTGPAMIISPDRINRHIATVIVASMTKRGREFPTRIPCVFQGKRGQVVLDQIRAEDKARLVRRLGQVSAATQQKVLSGLSEMVSA